jgi:hypothetical protein
MTSVNNFTGRNQFADIFRHEWPHGGKHLPVEVVEQIMPVENIRATSPSTFPTGAKRDKRHRPAHKSEVIISFTSITDRSVNSAISSMEKPF